MPMTFSLKRNLTSLYVIKIAKWMNLVMPIIVLFYNEAGLDMQDIFMLQSVYSLTLMTLEIPTGYFADIAGRRTSMLVGSFFGFIGYLIYASSSGFWIFVAAEVILGVGQSLISGADSAMLYDSLAAKRLSGKYTRLEGRITSLGNFGEAIAGIIGGALALISLQTPFIVQACVAFLAVPAAFSLREPPVHIVRPKPGIRDIVQVVRNTLISNRKLRWNTLFSAAIGTSTLTMAWFAQPFFKSVQLPLTLYGTAWAILNLSVGIAALYAWKVEKKLGPSRTVILITLSIVSGYFLLSFFPYIAALPVLLVFYFARGIATPTLRNYINLITTSDVRATVLSVRNFVIRFLFAAMGPLLGWVSDTFSLSSGFLMAGILFGILNGISLYFFIKYRTYE
ncbi:MAG: MFS transporter [Bacteroidales bacterium]|nr:MFS transporter [Bacteroidales bacterium]